MHSRHAVEVVEPRTGDQHELSLPGRRVVGVDVDQRAWSSGRTDLKHQRGPIVKLIGLAELVLGIDHHRNESISFTGKRRRQGYLRRLAGPEAGDRAVAQQGSKIEESHGNRRRDAGKPSIGDRRSTQPASWTGRMEESAAID